MGTTKTRGLKITWLRENLLDYFDKHKGGVVSKSKILANFALIHNSTERTGREILNQLEKAGQIKINGDDITQ